MEKQILDLKKLSENTKNFGIEGKTFSNFTFELISQIIFATLNNIERNRSVSINQFKKDVLSKRENPREYFKALIKFATQ